MIAPIVDLAPMRNPESWRPSKYVRRRGRLVASSDPAQLGVASRMLASAVAARYDECMGRYVRGRLADLGCGKVPLYDCYRHRVTEIVCVDWGGSAHGSLHVDVEADLGQPLPFGTGRFDSVVLSDVLEHVRRPGRLIDEIARVLAPGGHLLLNVPFLYGLHEVPHDYYRFTEFALRDLAQEAGFDVVELHVVGGWHHVVVDLMAKALARAPVVGSLLSTAVQWPVQLLDRTAIGRRWSERSGRRFPIGYFLVAQRRQVA